MNTLTTMPFARPEASAMRRRLITAATTCLVVLAAAAPSRAAAIFDFQFGNNATGQFTIGAATSDPGYFFVTSLELLTFIDDSLGPQSVDDVRVTRFEPGASFNPTTGAFRNYAAGQRFEDIGQLVLSGTIGPGSLIAAFGNSFQPGSMRLAILGNNGGLVSYSATGALEVQAVPEPASVLLVGLGAVGLLAARRRRTRGDWRGGGGNPPRG